MEARLAFVTLATVLSTGMGACSPGAGAGLSQPTEPAVSPTRPVLSSPTPAEPTLRVIQPGLITPTWGAMTTQRPAMVYFQADDLVGVSGEGTVRILATVPNAGSLKYALQLGNTALLLREEGLQEVSLTAGTSRLMTFDAPVLFGELVAIDGETALYSAVLDDGGGGAIGFTAHAGVYSQDTGLRPLIEREGSLVPLGLDSGGDDAYFLPLGGEPEFREVLLVSLASGAVRTRLTIEGYAFAALSPGNRWIATAGERFVPEEQRLDYGIRLYELEGDEVAQGLWLALPRSDSHVSGLIWSGDGRCLYFYLRPGAPSGDPAFSHGVWCLDPEGLTFSQVSPLDDPTQHFVMISPDDRWLVLRPERVYELTLLDLRSGTIVAPPLPIPFDDVVHWR